MKKESMPYGDSMGMKVAFCNALAVDLAQARRIVWVAGQLARDEQGKLVGRGDVAAQTEQCLKNIAGALQRFGAGLGDVVQVTVFVKEMSGLKAIHDVRLRYFPEPYPTSTLVAVKGFVDPEALIEINAVAMI